MENEFEISLSGYTIQRNRINHPSNIFAERNNHHIRLESDRNNNRLVMIDDNRNQRNHNIVFRYAPYSNHNRIHRRRQENVRRNIQIQQEIPNNNQNIVESQQNNHDDYNHDDDNEIVQIFFHHNNGSNNMMINRFFLHPYNSTYEILSELENIPRGISNIPFIDQRTHCWKIKEKEAISDDNRMCTICQCDFELGEEVRQLSLICFHIFHKECIDRWLIQHQPTCPVCRKNMVAF